eukprot:CAMPEP_0185809706 /NCGR_PEP_ID=MMETSP1322-20130828/6361_1 /TAXON_ID=265543 /ORGANISM="Minutocellus polymorphus, Strain RCC2270" /LENGTH=63 /DNA_ID=CAMNT_0028505995 /DNA_START=95 /DNA_END=286 /DNA_ORIENTATION=-
MMGLAQNTPTTLTNPNPAATRIMGHPNVPDMNRMGIFPILRKQKNTARVPTYDCGDNSLTDNK